MNNVKVSVEAPRERMVTIELPESDAYVLMKILGYTYTDTADSSQGAFLRPLTNKLMDAGLQNNGNAGVTHTSVGVRVYNAEKEW